MSINKDHSEDIDKLRLMDDKFMKVCLQNHPEIVELILQIVFDDKNIKVGSSFSQDHIANINGKDVVLDIIAEDSDADNIYDLEVQRKDEGANPRRARYITARLDSMSLDVNEEYKDLADTYVIFITENDYFKKNKQIYHISKVCDETGEKVDDGLHYIYVNASYKSDNKLGELCHDFLCANPKEMKIKELRDVTNHFKYEKGGIETMSAVFEKVKEEGREEGIIIARAKDVDKLVSAGIATLDKALEIIGITKEEYESVLIK